MAKLITSTGVVKEITNQVLVDKILARSEILKRRGLIYTKLADDFNFINGELVEKKEPLKKKETPPKKEATKNAKDD